MSDLIYYKRNVNYVVGGRHFPLDSQGWTMPNDNLYVAVAPENLRDFKIANKRAITEGLIIESQAPSIDWETNNAISPEEVQELIKQYAVLKQRLEKIDSFQTALTILEAAKESDRPTKTIRLIEAKLEELRPEEEDFSKDMDDMRETK